MTREEAIKRLYELQFYSSCKVDERANMADIWRETVSALDMAIAALREQPHWISVEERLPTRADANPNESVLAIAKDDGFARAWIWDIVERYYGEFTYWMPWPMPPKEDAQ